MKTPMQELYEQLERTIKEQEGLMSIDEYELFKAGMEMSIAIIEQDGHFEKEEEVIKDAYWQGGEDVPRYSSTVDGWYEETFKTKE